MDCPSRMFVAAFATVSASMTLPITLSTIWSADRIGTPDTSRVDNVRQNRDTATSRVIVPNTGTFRRNWSHRARPARPTDAPPPGGSEDHERSERDRPPADHQHVADEEHDPGDQRQRLAAAGHRVEQVPQPGDDAEEQPEEDQRAHEPEEDRVGDGREDLPLELHLAVGVHREPLQDLVERAGPLAGADHLDVELVEHLRVLGHRVAERRSPR